jgi:hypothetical protein
MSIYTSYHKQPKSEHGDNNNDDATSISRRSFSPAPFHDEDDDTHSHYSHYSHTNPHINYPHHHKSRGGGAHHKPAQFRSPPPPPASTHAAKSPIPSTLHNIQEYAPSPAFTGPAGGSEGVIPTDIGLITNMIAETQHQLALLESSASNQNQNISLALANGDAAVDIQQAKKLLETKLDILRSAQNLSPVAANLTGVAAAAATAAAAGANTGSVYKPNMFSFNKAAAAAVNEASNVGANAKDDLAFFAGTAINKGQEMTESLSPAAAAASPSPVPQESEVVLPNPSGKAEEYNYDYSSPKPSGSVFKPNFGEFLFSSSFWNHEPLCFGIKTILTDFGGVFFLFTRPQRPTTITTARTTADPDT